MSSLKETLFEQIRTLLNRHIVFLLSMSCLSASFGQTTYYVASSGSDTNNGRSSDAPFQTITKVNSLALQAGDQVLFRRGDTFRGTLQITRSGSAGSPITFDAYGSGNKPVLAGSSLVTNWTNIGNNVWQATCSACGDRVTGVYRDNNILPLGRYPNLDASNKGYLTVQSHSGRSSLTSQQALTTNWTGGEAVFRPVNWILNRSKITGQSGNTLQLDGSGTYDVSDQWGYFIQNHPSTLDQVGEWYYNSSNKTIQLYDNQSNPNNSSIAATTAAQSVVLTGASYITIQNVQLAQSLNTGLYATNSSNLTINNDDIVQSGEDAVSLQGSGSQILMTGNLIENANNNGLIVGAYQNFTFRGNTVRKIGLVPGAGKSGDGTYVGLLMGTTANTLIENNVVDNIGYIAINFSTSTTVQHNQISNYCITKSDGSGLYIWNGNQQGMSDMHLLSNVVYNGIGAPEGTPSGQTSEANGIYLDDCTTNIEVANNTVYNCTGMGIYFHGTSNSRLTGNTVFNCGEAQVVIRNVNGCPPRNNVIQGNQFISRLASQPTAKYESGSQGDVSNFGQFDNNVYARPFDDVNKIHVYYGNVTGGTDISLAQWQSQFGRDLTSSSSPITYSSGNPDDYIKFTANPTASSIQVTLDGTYRDPLNKVYTGSVTIAPYSSLVLFKDASTPTTLRTADNPANATAGLDYSYYEGTWNLIPDFSTLTAIKTGTVTVPNIANERNRTYNYALRYTGYISVPTDGVYTFYTSSDDGSKLYIGSTLVVSNDALQAETERSGTIGLKAGLHAITIQYMQSGGDQALTVSYSGPGLNKQAIPASAYYRVAPTASLRTPDNPANATAGLDYKYYEGSWSLLPDFSTLTPVKTGTVSVPNITNDRSRTDYYALVYTGYVSVPTDGVYTFYTSADDGSKLYIGNTLVVSNDGLGAEREVSGTIGLKAGVHAITIQYMQANGGQALTVSYSGPNLGKQAIPASAYYRVATTTTTPPTVTLRTPDNPANATAGLDYKDYEGTWSLLPDFSTLTPVKTGTVSVPNITNDRSRTEYYALLYTGYVSVPTDGVYTFYTSSDDGSKLYIGSTLVVNNDALQAETERSGTIGLKAGVHAITIQYMQANGGQALTVSYSGPSLGKQAIPASAYYRVATTTTTPTQPSNNGSGVYLSDLNWVSATNGYGPVEKDKSNGESNAGDGHTITLNGVTYAKGLGAHAPSEIVYNLNGQYTRFITDVGIDDEETNCGSAVFNVYVDNVLVYSSGVMTPTSPTQSINVDVTGKQTLRLVIADGGDGYSCDHGDWAGARLTPASGTTTTPSSGNGTYLSDLNWASTTNGYGPVEKDKSNGESNAGDGHTITLNGVTYAKGLGAHAPSEIVYNLNGQYTRFITDVGIDDEETNCGSAVFNVYVDNVLVYSSGVMTPTSPTQSINVDVTGKQTLRLVIADGGDGYSCDHGDWAGARLTGYAGSRSVSLTTERNPEQVLQVFPVPAQEELQVRYYAEQDGEVTIQLVNILGQAVRHVKQPVVQGENLIKLLVGEFSRGNYILNLTQDKQNLSRKVLLIK